MSSYVYLAKCDNRFVKVGKSDDPKVRINGLMTYNPLDFTLIKTYAFDDELKAYIAEDYLQKSLTDLHHRGEWFHYTSDFIERADIEMEGLDREFLNYQVEQYYRLKKIEGYFRDLGSRKVYAITRNIGKHLLNNGFPYAAPAITTHQRTISTILHIEEGAADVAESLLKENSKVWDKIQKLPTGK